MKNVLIYRNDLLPISETFVLEQAKALRAFHPKFMGVGKADRSLEIPSDAILLTRNSSLFSRVRKRLYWMTGFAPYFHRRAATVNAELVHAHFGPDGITAAHIASVLGLPLIVTLHGFDVTIPRNSPDFYARVWKRASLFLCVSNFIRAKAIEAGFPEEKLRVHYIGINTSSFTPASTPANPNSVLFVSRLMPKKGCEYLLRAMAIVQAARPAVELTIIGDGPLRAQLEELAGSLRINCRFLGAQPADVVRKQLESARVFCVPSVTADNGDSEGLGMVFAEAQAMGVPVVSFEHGGIPEVVQNGVTGVLVPEKDYEALARGLLRYLTDDDFWNQSRIAGIAWIREGMELSVQTAELESIYSDVVSQYRMPGESRVAGAEIRSPAEPSRSPHGILE